ncbi:phosphotriesterase-related protein [Chelonus insularis]|uniref:phosphotriesterase-related protein n=1 Tax=Chelonus insularis TaxID=460826 RepID=UPI001588B052|nr:phosphotriesterase-related protein [Chelonus insularis]
MDTTSVETVLGPTRVSQLGKTLTHEHLTLDFNKFYVPPPKLLENYFQSKKIDLTNVGLVKQYPYSSSYNVNFNDDDTLVAVLEDVKMFKKFGGGTIVENTSYGIRRDIPFAKKVSQETGVNIIIGTGHYVEAVQNMSVLMMSEEKIYDLVMKELTQGCEEFPEVKAGFIGEVGSSWPITDFEKRAIRSAAQVQEQLGSPISFHPGRNPQAPFEIMRIFLEAGGDPRKTIMSHLDRSIPEKAELLEFAKLRSYCQFDLFGTECSYYQLDEKTDMPSDAQRLQRIGWIKEDRGIEQILMSHDIHTKHRLVRYGGHGYSHILINIVPRMLAKGFSPEEIDAITIVNPKTWLSRRE